MPLPGVPRTFQQQPAVAQGQKVFLDKNGENFPFLAEKGVSLLPYDYEIGPLQDYTAADKEQQSIITLLTGFFDAFIKGNITATSLLKEKAAVLSGYLDYAVKKKLLTGYRIGSIEVKGSSAEINLRLYSAAGSTEGEVFVEKKGQWYLSDLQVNFDALERAGVARSEKFLPGSYYWMLKEK